MLPTYVEIIRMIWLHDLIVTKLYGLEVKLKCLFLTKMSGWSGGNTMEHVAGMKYQVKGDLGDKK